MKKLLISFLIAGALMYGSHAVEVVSTNMTVSTTKLVPVTTDFNITSIKINELVYNFNTDLVRVSLSYLDGLEQVATGWASITPYNVENYKVLLFNTSQAKVTTLIIPKVALDAGGLQQGKDVVTAVALALGEAITQLH